MCLFAGDSLLSELWQGYGCNLSVFPRFSCHQPNTSPQQSQKSSLTRSFSLQVCHLFSSLELMIIFYRCYCSEINNLLRLIKRQSLRSTSCLCQLGQLDCSKVFTRNSAVFPDSILRLSPGEEKGCPSQQGKKEKTDAGITQQRSVLVCLLCLVLPKGTDIRSLPIAHKVLLAQQQQQSTTWVQFIFCQTKSSGKTIGQAAVTALCALC